MKTYTITKVAGAADWNAVPALAIDTLYRDPAPQVKAFAQIAYNEEALLVRLTLEAPVIRAVETGKYGMPCEDSCLEFFFSPMEGDVRYLNFEFNANKCLFLGMGSCIEDLVRIIPDEEPIEELFRPETVVSETSFEITYQVPFSFVRRFFPGFAPASGKTMRANCFTCADNTEPPHYLCWSPVVTRPEPRTFHWPYDFGQMIFE